MMHGRHGQIEAGCEAGDLRRGGEAHNDRYDGCRDW